MKLDEVKLTADQKRYWMNSKTAFAWAAPGWNSILVGMLNPNNSDAIVYWTKDIERLATDGRIILANPEYFFGLKLKQRVAALGHEVAHAVLMHIEQAFQFEQVGTITIGPGETLPYNDQIAELCQDLVINQMLKGSRIGELHEEWFYDEHIDADAGWIEVYKEMYKRLRGKAANISMQFPGMKGFDQHLPPGTSAGKPPQQAVEDRKLMEQAWKNAIAQAAAITRELGMNDGGANQQKFFDKMLEPKVSWQDEITAEFSRMPGSGSYDWMRPDDELMIRGIYAPSRSGFGCNTIAMFLDSSGSIYAVPQLIDRWFAELKGILGDLKPKRIIVVWCDAQVRKTYEITDEQDLAECYHDGAHGGGGTSFVPPFEWVKEQEIDDIDMAVYLTDGDGTFPSEEPNFPVVWGDISGYVEKYPKWARVVKVPNDGTA